MSAAQHTPTTADGRDKWCVGAGDPTLVFVPGIVKPISVGSAERAARIVQCVNAHDKLVAALRLARMALDARCAFGDADACGEALREAGAA